MSPSDHRASCATPVISVVLPVFNGACTVARAVRSILGQSLREIELIVVDDGSTDDTVDIVRAIGDPRLRLITGDHRGVVAAANNGTRLSRAPLIARMDADDFSYPTRFEKQLDLLRARDLEVVGCQVRILTDSTESRHGGMEPAPSMQRYQYWINEQTIAPGAIAAFRFVELPLANATILARRRYFELGFEDSDRPEDYDLMLRAAAQGIRFGKVAQVLFDWFDHPRRLTRRDNRYSRDAFTRCRRKYLLQGPIDGVRHVDLWGIGRTGKPWLRWLQSHNVQIRQGYDIHPRKVNTRIHGVPVAHPRDLSPADGTPLIIAVGAAGAHATILPQIQARGYTPGSDAWFVA